MRRTFALAMMLAVLAPLAPLIASICSSSPCCAGVEERIVAAMPCCQPAMCASPEEDGRQPKAADTVTPILVATGLIQVDETVAPRHSVELNQEVASPPPVRIRLALISTLLI